MVSILINGACGKMGRVLAECAMEQGFPIVAGFDRYLAGAKTSFPLYERARDCDAAADVLIDFSRPEALDDLLPYALERNMALVLATTGYSEEQLARIEAAARRIPIFKTANMSVGVNILMELVKTAAESLPDFDVEIVETHHNAKVDAPSGTALLLAQGVTEASAQQKQLIYGRAGKNARRKAEEVGVHAVRGGTVTGRHEVYFLGQDEEITLSHSAASRRIFALGALRAAAFVAGRPPKIYEMKDALLEHAGVTHVTLSFGQALCTLRGGVAPAAQLLKKLADQQISVDMISQSAPAEGAADLSFTLCADDLAQAGLEGVRADRDVVKLTVQGMGMERQAGVAAQVFALLAQSGVHPLMVTTSETQIALCLRPQEAQTAAQAIRAHFAID